MGNLRDLKAKAPKPKHSAFKAYEPGYIHIDVKYLPQMADESRRRYLFVAIDRATRWVFIRVFPAKTAANARRFLRDLERACPMRIRTVLTEWKRVHGSALRPAQARRDGRPRVRHALRRPRDRPSPDPAEVPPDQRYGRTLQWPDRGGPPKPPFPIRRGTGGDAAPRRLALQSAAPAISPRQQDAVAGCRR